MELISREKAIEYATQAHISGSVQQRIVDLLNSVPLIEDMTTDYSEGFDKGYNRGYIDGCADGEANATSRPKGKWLPQKELVVSFYECSECGAETETARRYCAWCGALMEIEE